MSFDITVVVPTRDRERLLLRAVRSALAQRGVSVQVVVVDDGSVDGTAAAALALQAQGVRLIRHERPLGSSVARNAGVEAARTPWVAFLDDDDVWAPGKLETQLKTLSTQPRLDGTMAGWACCSAVLIDGRDRLIGWNPVDGPEVGAKTLLSHNGVPGGGSSVVARRDLVLSVGGFAADVEHSEDWDLWIRLALESGNGLAVQQPLVGYRVWMSSSSRIKGLEADWRAILARYPEPLARFGVAGDELPLHYYRAFRAMHSRQFRAAAGSYWRVAQLERSISAAVLGLGVGVAGPMLFPLWSYLNGRRVPAEVRRRVEPWLAAGAEPGVASIDLREPRQLALNRQPQAPGLVVVDTTRTDR